MSKHLTKSLKLPFQFNGKLLQQDLQIVLKSDWISHFNPNDYEGQWTVVSLYAPNGEANNIFALNNEKVPLLPTPIMNQCPYFQEILTHFECPFYSVRLLKLHSGAFIKPHRDHALGYEDGCFRLHIPIITHPDVEFILEEKRLDMQVGECWYTNVNYTHSVANRSPVDRVHLVIDGQRNEWSDQLFFSLAPEESFQPPKPKMSKTEVLLMIEELKLLNTPAASSIIADLNRQLQEMN